MENKIRQVIADQLEIGIEEVIDGSSLRSLGCDCLDEVEILMELEREFDIRIDDDKFELCKNVSDLIELVNSYL